MNIAAPQMRTFEIGSQKPSGNFLENGSSDSEKKKLGCMTTVLLSESAQVVSSAR
jgi:hypothetical protein